MKPDGYSEVLKMSLSTRKLLCKGSNCGYIFRASGIFDLCLCIPKLVYSSSKTLFLNYQINLYDTRVIMPKRTTSAEPHLRHYTMSK